MNRLTTYIRFREHRILNTDYFAVRYSEGGTLVLYHRSDPRKALWESYEMKAMVDYVRLSLGE